MRTDNIAHREICVFRGRAVGGKRSAKRILQYFTFPDGELSKVFCDGYVYENDTIKVTSSAANEIFNISIKFKITIV